MWRICLKEWQQFFSSLTGYLAIVIFLLLLGLFLFIFPDSSILDYGYASLDTFFSIVPYLLLFLIPTITMRSISDEYKSGSFEILKTLPLSSSKIIWGKYFGCVLIIAFALIPTFIYGFSIQLLSAKGGIDLGAAAGSYLGLIMLACVYIAVGICTSSYTDNTIVAFIFAAFICFILYSGFGALSKLPVLTNGSDYYISMLGIDFHYKNISRGVVDSADIIYFMLLIITFLFITIRKVETKEI